MLIISVSYDMQHNIACSECWCSECIFAEFVKLYAYVEALLLFTIAIPIPITITRWKKFDDHENKALSSKLLWNSSITVLEVFCASIMIQNILFFQMEILP